MRTLEELGISPTPWYVQEYYYSTNVPAVEGAVVFDENGGQRDIFFGNLTSIENARLIASAPDLYRALREVVEAFDRGYGLAMTIKEARYALEKTSGEEAK